MTIKASGTQLGFQEIEAEFGAQSPRSLGSYRHTQTVNGLTFNGIDSGVPSSGEIKFSDFYGKSLNIVVDCFSGGDEFRINAKNNKWNNNNIVIINPSTVSKKEEGTKITIRVNKKFGSERALTAQRRSTETPTDPVDGASSAMSARIAGQSVRHRAQLCQWRRPRAWPRPDRASLHT